MKMNQLCRWSVTLALFAFAATPLLPPASLAEEALAEETDTRVSGETVAGPGASLVRVNVTAQAYNLYQPWEKGQTATRSGLGVLLQDGQVLVTAQLVSDATYVELELPRSGAKATAEVSVVDYEANLALVRLSRREDETRFLTDFRPAPIDSSATPGDTLDVWQVRDNGTPVSTACQLIEVNTSSYFLNASLFLTFEIKGSLQYHQGSFVLPVFRGERLAGLLLSYEAEEQISEIIPSPIIEHFLQDMRDGHYQGFPTLGLAFARTTDEQLRDYLKLEKDGGGVYVSTVVPDSTAERAGLQVGDVLLSIDGHEIDARGNYDHPLYGKLNFSHLVRGAGYVGHEIEMRVWREGEALELTGELSRKEASDYLIDPYLFDQGPKYVIQGGLVFQELTEPYLRIFGDQWEQRAPIKLIWALAHPDEYEEKGREKLVFLSRVIRTPVTLGYEALGHLIVDKVNGKKINNLAELSEAFKSPESGLHRIELAEAPNEIFLEARTTALVNERIQEAFRIPALERLE